MSENSLFTIHPYRYHGTWVFDDPGVGLEREPFVSGADTIIDVFAENIPEAESGFDVVFSAAPFPGCDAELAWVRAELDGNWYRLDEPPMEGWLCPALLKYFDSPPKRLYVKFG